jgi:hypothetical protein
MGNSIDSVHGPWTMPDARSTVDHQMARTRGPLERGDVLAGAQPSATLGHGSSSVGVQKEEGNAGS